MSVNALQWGIDGSGFTTSRDPRAEMDREDPRSIADIRRPQQRGETRCRFGAECYVTDSYNGLLHGQVMCPQRTASQLVNIWLEKDQQGL